MYVIDIKNEEFTLKEYYRLEFTQNDLCAEDLEQAFKKIKNCKILRIRSMLLDRLPTSVNQIEGLKNIYLDCPAIQEIPADFFPDDLEDFQLHQCNNLTTLPERLFRLPRLRTLTIGKTAVALPKEVNLPRLDRLYLDIKNLRHLPASILTESLVYLQITSEQLQDIPTQIANCTNLMHLQVNAPLTTPLPSLHALERLNVIQLRKTRFKQFEKDFDFPPHLVHLIIEAESLIESLPDVSKLQGLQYVTLRQVGDFPKGLAHCTKLRRLFVRELRAKAIPDLSTCTDLESISVAACPIAHFPMSVFNLKKLIELHLEQTQIRTLPETWGKLPLLRQLNLNHNQLHFADFDFISAFPKLKTLTLEGNTIASPYILMTNKRLPLTSQIKFLAKIKYANVGNHRYGRKRGPDFLDFAAALGRSKLNFIDKKWFFDLVAGIAHIQELPQLDLSQFLKGLNINFKPLRLLLEKKLIQKVLLQHLSTLDIFQNPLVFELPAQLKKGDCLYITGQTTLAKSDIKAQAEELELTVLSRYSDAVTHVVLGRNSDDWEADEKGDFTMITERALRAYFSKVAPKYLEAAEQAGEKEMVQNVIQLLENDNEQNIQLALAIMEGGGVPKMLLEDLLVLFKTSDNEAIRQSAKDLLLLHAPASWMDLVKNRLEFHQEKLLQNPKEIRKKLEQLSNQISADVAAFFTFLLQKKWNGQIGVQIELDDALYEIAKQLPIEEKLLQAGARVFVNGTTRLKKTEIKEKLQAVNIQYAAKYDDKVTHVLVGNNPKTWDIAEENIHVLTENHLQTYLSQVAPQYLEQAAAEEGSEALTDNLAALLNSPDSTSVSVALEMMDAGGVPPDLMPMVLVVAKADTNAKVRAKARKLLELYAPADWLPMIKNKLLFKGITANAKESDITKKLDKLAKEASVDLAAILSLALFKKYERGLRFVLKKSNKKAYQTALELLLEGTHVKFSRGLGYKNWRDTAPEAVMLFSGFSTGVKFSSHIKDLGLIESIDFHNCKFNSMPKSITTFTDLKKLDFSHNSISKLPLGFHKLEKLEVLNLQMNKFEEFPLRIAKMKNLKKLDLSYNRSRLGFLKLEVPEEVRLALPNCEIVV